MPLLSIDIEARYAKFVDAMSAIERSAKKSAGNVTSAFKGINGVLGGLGAGISVAGLVAVVKNAIDAADHLNDLSKQTGVAVDVLGGLGFAASQAGGNLDGIAGAAGKLNKSIAEAAGGNKEFSVAFQKLGIDIREANGNLKTADKVMVELANKFESFADGPEKAAIAMRFLGKAGADQIALLNDGGRALQANIDLYRRYAGVTQETASKADAFNDNLERLRLIASAFGRQLAAELLPSLEAVSTELLRAKENGEGLKGWAEKGAGAIKTLGGAAVTQVQTFAELAVRMEGVVAQSKALATLDFSKFLEESGKIRERLDGLKDSYGGLRSAIKNGQAANPFDQVFNIVEGNIGQDKRLLETRVQLLQKYNNEGLILDKDFYAARDAAQREYIANTKKNIGAEIGILKEKAKRTKDAKEAESINAQIADLVLKRESVGADKPRAPILPGSGVVNDGALRTLEGQLKSLERQSEAERELFASRKDMLQSFYEQDLIAINDYYAARQAAAQEALNAQKANIDEEIALLEKRKPKDESERASNESKIRELEDRRSKLEAEAASETTKNLIDQAQAAKAFQKELEEINLRLLEQKGFLATAAGQNFDQQTAQIRTKIQSELEAANASGDSARVLELQVFEKKLGMLREIAVAQGRINELQEVEGRIQSDLTIAYERADAAAADGSQSQLESLRKISDARQQAAIDMMTVANAFSDAAEKTGDQRFIQQAKEMRAQAEKLGATADLVREKFKGVFETGVNSFFDKLIDGTTSIKQAFKDLFSDIASDLARAGISNLTDQLFKKKGALGGVVDLVSGVFAKPGSSTAASGIAAVAGSVTDATGAAALATLATSTAAADAGMIALGVSLPVVDGGMAALSVTTVAVDAALASVATAALSASVALDAVAGASASSGITSGSGGLIGLFDGLFGDVAAKGNAYMSGNVIPFANGGIPEVVNHPTLFPMSGRRTGLMGEAGPEAIMPLHRDTAGQLAIKVIGMRGNSGLLPLARDGSGKLSVRAAEGVLEKFAVGGVFQSGIESRTAGFFGSEALSPRASVVPGFMAPVESAGGGNVYHISVDVPAGTPRESADQIAQRTAIALQRASRRNG